MRRKPPHEPLDTVPGHAEPADPRPLPDEQVEERVRRDWMRQAIRQLPPILRETLMLALEDLPTAEIAEVLGISENNVAVRLTRARKTLKRYLEEAK